jgi:hypothetical protein
MHIISPTKRLMLWVIEQGGRVHWTEYHRMGIELGCPPPGQNGAFGTCAPSMVRDGDFRVITDAGRERAQHYS